MAVAVPRTAPARPRRSKAVPKAAPVRGTRTGARSNTVGRKATIHRAPARAGVGGRLAPFRIAAVIGLIGVVLSMIVYLHVASLRATMQAGSLRAQVEETRSGAADIQAQTEQQLADGRVERAAAAYGMVLVPSQAMRTLRVSIPRALQSR